MACPDHGGPRRLLRCVETKDGLHIWEDHSSEVINPRKTGQPVADGGKKGELVLHRSTKEAFLDQSLTAPANLTRLLARARARIAAGWKKVTAAATDMIISCAASMCSPRRSRNASDGDTRTRPAFQIEGLSKLDRIGSDALLCECATPPLRDRPLRLQRNNCRADQRTVGNQRANSTWAMWNSITRSEGKACASSTTAPKG